MKKILIVESPNKAREISHMKLGVEPKATLGHIADLPPDKMGMEITPDKVYFALEPLKNKKKTIAELKKACRGNVVYIASDPDREGEAIAWHVYREIKKVAKEIYRIDIHAITKNEIEKALKNTRSINENLVEAQVARRLTDRWIGYVLSPLASQELGKKVSVGRTQTAGLRIVYDREMAIKKFVPEPLWKVVLKGPDEFASNVFKDEARAKALLEALKKGVFVSDIEKKRESKSPPAPLTASSMQQKCAAFKWNAKKTMSTAQSLFEKGLISYHRTDSVRLSDETLSGLKNYLKDKHPELLSNEPVKHRNKNRTQDAHEAIHPTCFDEAHEPGKVMLPSDEKLLYSLIWSSTLASQSKPSLYEVVIVKAGNDVAPDALKAVGKKRVFDGWERFVKEKQEKSIGEYKKGQKLEGDMSIVKSFTTPPPRYDDGTFIKTLESNGIGRPSTYATIQETLFKRGYVKKEKGKYILTDLGRQVVEWAIRRFPEIADVQFTAHLEEMLDAVELGEEDWENVVRQVDGIVRREVLSLNRDIT